MNTVLVWVLMTLTHVHNGHVLTYSPHVHDLESCKRMQEQISGSGNVVRSTCVQIRVPVPGAIK